jgi:hypothetical protein
MTRSISVSGITVELIFIDIAFEISINHGSDKCRNALKM